MCLSKHPSFFSTSFISSSEWLDLTIMVEDDCLPSPWKQSCKSQKGFCVNKRLEKDTVKDGRITEVTSSSRTSNDRVGLKG